MKDTTSKLLAHSKEFYISGELELEQNTNMAYMQATLKFHDAIEYCVRAIIEEYTINHDRNLDLIPLMKCINNAIPNKKLPFASQMDFLNTTRGKIKHHASIPSFEDVQRCRLNARDFLEKVTIEYFGINFLSVSRLLLIENSNVRQYLEDADDMINKGEYLEALIQIKKAFYLARPSDRTFINKDNFFTGFFLTSGFRNIPEFKKPIEKIIQKLNEIEENITLLMMGIDILKLRRFEEITPHFYFVMGGEYSLLIHWDDAILPSEELAKEASNYVVDMTILWQRKGVVGHRPDFVSMNNQSGNSWREVRRERWSY